MTQKASTQIGKFPEGILIIDKPKGKTSFYLVHLLRKITKIKKIGHAGTLDPLATGVMVMLIGKNYTKQSDLFLQHDKEYLATILLGFTSDTYDSEGTITPVSSKIPKNDEILSAIETFQGKIKQIPPMYSAKQKNGQRLYDLARKGITIERDPIEVSVQTTLVDYSYPHLTLKIKASKGTYIRSIAHDVGNLLGCGAHIIELTRTKSGPFSIEKSLRVETLTAPLFNYSEHLQHFL